MTVIRGAVRAQGQLGSSGQVSGYLSFSYDLTIAGILPLALAEDRGNQTATATSSGLAILVTHRPDMDDTADNVSLDWTGPLYLDIYHIGFILGSLPPIQIGTLSETTTISGNQIAATASLTVITTIGGLFGQFPALGQFTISGGLLSIDNTPIVAARPRVDSGGSFAATLHRSGEMLGADSVGWTITSAVPASGGLDAMNGYWGTSGVATIPAGASSFTFNVPVPPGSAVRPDDPFVLTLHDPSTGASLGGASVSGVISGGLRLGPGEVALRDVDYAAVVLRFPNAAAASVAAAIAETVNEGLNDYSWGLVGWKDGVPLTEPGTRAYEVVHQAGSISLRGAYGGLVSDAAGAVTVSGGDDAGSFVLAGTGGVAFNAGAGSGTVVSAGGNNLISIYPGAGDQSVWLGDGDDTVVALAGSNRFTLGTGHHRVLLGDGTTRLTSAGADLVAALGRGAATIEGGAGGLTAYLGAGATELSTPGAATVVAGAGPLAMTAGDGAMAWLGGGDAMVALGAAATLVGGTGAARVTLGDGGLLFGGQGPLEATAAAAATLLGADGALTLHGGAGGLVALTSGSVTYDGRGGADTVAAIHGSLTVRAGTGTFLGGPEGRNDLAAGAGPAVLFGGGDGDTLRAGAGTGVVALVAGAGAETLTGAGGAATLSLYAGPGQNLLVAGAGPASFLASTGSATMVGGSGLGLFAFAKGNAGQVTIAGFNPALHYLSMPGFSVAEVASALAGAATVGGSQSITLSDGTHITLQGFVGLTAANLL